MACNQFGTAVVIDREHCLRWCDIRGTEQQTCKLLNVGNYDKKIFQEHKFTNISFNSSGNMILCWSSASVGVVHIPQICVRDGSLNVQECEESTLPFSLLVHSNEDYGVKFHIVQAAFHPLSPVHVMILLSNEQILLTNALRNMSERIPIHRNILYASCTGSDGAGDPFVRFCFGGNCDWMRLTIFLATQKGKIYFLCPIVPKGAIVPKPLIEVLHTWVTHEHQVIKDDKFKAEVSAYLRTAFEEHASLAHVPEEIQEISIPLLQGPLIVRRGTGFNVGSAVLSEHSRQSSKVCDICCPQSSHRNVREAPVLAIAYDDGFVDLLLHDPNTNQGECFICPLWSHEKHSARETLNNRQESVLPNMLLVEEIDIGTNEHKIAKKEEISNNPVLRFTTDPVYSHVLHLADFRKSAAGYSCLLSVGWLKDLLYRQRKVEADKNWENDESDQEILELESSKIIPVLQFNANSNPLSGMCIVSDAMLGHMAIIRSARNDDRKQDSEDYIKNITVIKRTFEYASTFQGNTLIAGEEKVKTNNFESKAKNLLDEVQLAIEKIPHVNDHERINADIQNSTYKAKLQESSEFLKKNIIVHLESLALRTVSTLDGLRLLFEEQKEVLENRKGAKALFTKMLNENVVNSEKRIEAIGEKLCDQRKRIKEVVLRYTQVVNLNRGMSVSEKAYRKEIDEWRRSLQSCERDYIRLEALVKVATGEIKRAGGELIARGSLADLGQQSPVAPSILSPSPMRRTNAISAGGAGTTIPTPSTGGKSVGDRRKTPSMVKNMTPAKPAPSQGPLELTQDLINDFEKLEQERGDKIKTMNDEVQRLREMLDKLKP